MIKTFFSPASPFGVLAASKRAFERASQLIKNSADPLVGKHIASLLIPQLLYRVDGRTPSDLLKSNGFPQAMCIKQANNSLRKSHIEGHQQSNVGQFALPACRSLNDLEKGFITKHSSFAKERKIYAFYGNAACLRQLKIKTGIEPSQHDDEHEQLVMEQIKFHQIIACVSGKQQEDFLLGRTVENKLYGILNVPEKMTRKDISSFENTLNWLLNNGCEETAIDMANCLGQPIEESSEIFSMENALSLR